MQFSDLVDFTERIRIDGAQIPPEKVAHYCSMLKDGVLDNHSTFFEATTAIAFRWLKIYAAKRGGRSMAEKLAAELMDALLF